MAAVPKKKHTRSRSNIRRGSPTKKGALPNLVKCPSCKKLKRTHQVCPHCDFYKK